jgi:hypothetical protein
MISDKLLSASHNRLGITVQQAAGEFGMFEVMLLFVSGILSQSRLDVTSLFDFAAGLVAFFFVIVCVLIFIFVYDNLRRERKTASTTVP